MIAIETMDGSLVKTFKDFENTEFGFHQFFGFTTPEKAKTNQALKKRQGFDLGLGDWVCTFKIATKGSSFELKDLKDCTVKKIDDQSWVLETPAGNFKVGRAVQSTVASVGTEVKDDNAFINRSVAVVGIATAAFMIGLYLLPRPEITLVEEVPEIPVMVKVVQPPKVVNVAQNMPKEIAKVIAKNSASMKNLGFLGLIGDKNLKKNANGAPTKLTKASAGAGPGGLEGSGGEMLVGLGEGLKKTTVGNSGVAGLGGIGTKGAGGGKGGYGNSLVASGNGKGLQEMSITNSDMVLDGGLSKYAINATIAKYLSQVRRCYEDELKILPALEGLVSVDFEVGPAGKLNYARTAKSTLDNKNVQNCINQKMMTWEFPKPKGGVNVKVNYPFMLRPVGN